MKVGEAVAIVRNARGWTQEKLAKAARIHQSSISEIETGDRERPRKRTIYKIAKALSITPELLSDPRVSETELLDAVRGKPQHRKRHQNSSHPTAKTLLPTRSLPVLRREDLEGVPLKGGASIASDRQMPARTDDPEAFYLVAEGPELTWEIRCPEGAELLLEPSVPPEADDLVVVRSPAGLALRRLVVGESRELRSLTPGQATLVWTSGIEIARVARVAVDPSIWR